MVYIRRIKPSVMKSRRFLLRWTIKIDAREKSALNACLFVCLDAVWYAVTVMWWSNEMCHLEKWPVTLKKCTHGNLLERFFFIRNKFHSEWDFSNSQLFQNPNIMKNNKQQNIKHIFEFCNFLIVFVFSIFLWSNFVVDFNL